MTLQDDLTAFAEAHASIKALREERDRYRKALEDLLEEATDMRSYVPDYFAKKWQHDDALERARAVLEA